MGRVTEGTSSQTPNPKAGLMGLNHSQTTLLSQKQGWKCACDGLSLKAQGEEDDEEKKLSPTCATRTDWDPHARQRPWAAVQRCTERQVLGFFPSPKKKASSLHRPEQCLNEISHEEKIGPRCRFRLCFKERRAAITACIFNSLLGKLN